MAAITRDPSDVRCASFYCRVMDELRDAQVPFLVGGAFALQRYGGIVRDTKDLDLFVRPSDGERALDALARAGYRTELTAPHWLGKILEEDIVVDVIWSSGNGVAKVDDDWFDHAVDEPILGMPAKLIPPEEMIWQKAYIMERERFDGGDVNHLLRARAEQLDWERLIRRFGEHWRVLLAHLILFGFAYPTERHRIPAAVLREMTERLRGELDGAAATERVANGTLLSRAQYRVDVGSWGYRDARLRPPAGLTEQDIAEWDQLFANDDIHQEAAG
jgi:hypothetical protein